LPHETDGPAAGAGGARVSHTRLDIRDGVATLTLDRPEAMNSLHPPMIDEIRAIVDRVARDDDVRVLVIAGSERVFSAGADLKHVQDTLQEPRRFFEFNRHINALMFELEEAPLPTVAMVRGYALAGGLELILACDLAIASEDACIGDQHANYGLIPGAGGTQRLPRRVGIQRGKELLFTGRRLTGTEAAAIGLVLRAVPSARLQEEVDALTAELASKSKRGMGFTKRAVDRGAGLPMRQAMDEEGFALFEYFTSSPSPQVGLDAFAQRTVPVFPE
jgi:enoyl-CoA hydratase/carnithine racemase